MTNLRSSTCQKFLLAVAFLAAVLLLSVTSGCGGGGSSPSTTDTPGTTGGEPASVEPTQPAPAPGMPQPAAPSTPVAKHSTHSRCGWLGADTAAAGTKSFVANPDYFDAVHPKWFTLNPDGSPRAIAFTDDKTVTDTARAHGVKLIPLVDADDPSYLRGIFSSPQRITAHVQQLVKEVMTRGYDGIELDYEHLWQASDRPGYTALIKEAGAALHAQGKVLTLALPAMDHDSASAYDYAALNPHVDVMHLMGYDFHYMGGDHVGPLAPRGWIADVVKRAASIGDPKKYVLGLANYGIANGWYGTIPDAIAKCGGTYSSATAHMGSCALGARESGLTPNCVSPSVGAIFFEDPASLAEKAQLAKASGLGGIGYWTVGSEPNGFFAAIEASYPR